MVAQTLFSTRPHPSSWAAVPMLRTLPNPTPNSRRFKPAMHRQRASRSPRAERPALNGGPGKALWCCFGGKKGEVGSVNGEGGPCLHAPADHAQHVAAGEDHVDEGLAAGNGDRVVLLEVARRPEPPE